MDGDGPAAEQGTRRGRRAIVPDPADGPAARFARALLDLKRSAGDPSYDAMRAELGAAASKSALSGATRGRALPSWVITWEFVRCLAVKKLGGDENAVRREWRDLWEAANAELANPPESPVTDNQSVTETVPVTGNARTPEHGRGPLSRSRLLAVGGALALVGTLAVVVLPDLLRGSAQGDTGAAPSYPIPGDDSGFGGGGFPGDVTYPDGTAVHVGVTFDKVWRLKNTGTVPWRGRQLQIAGGTTALVCITAID